MTASRIDLPSDTSEKEPLLNRKKLIEVALPLEAINTASAREKSIRHGHPSTLHLWWARRPLAAARAVIFSQMVDDPSTYVDTLQSDPARKRAAERELKKRALLWHERQAQYDAALAAGGNPPEPGDEPTLADCLADLERERLFKIIEDLVKWENTTNETVLQAARDEIWQSWRRACADNADHPRAKELFDRHTLPAFHDPFAGGGALPLEAQRLGLEAHASDLNPVAVTINKAMIEIPPRFAGRAPVGPKQADDRQDDHARDWSGAKGLAEDVRRYGAWMRDEAQKRIGHLYPKITVTAEMVAERPDLQPLLGQHLTVIAWLWARTVQSPNPAFAGVEVPLASTFVLSKMKGNDAYVHPVVEGKNYRFEVKVGTPPAVAVEGTKALGRGANFRCIVSDTVISADYIKAEGQAGRIGSRMMAVVAEGVRSRIYLSPDKYQEGSAKAAAPDWRPSGDLPARLTGGTCVPYGLKEWGDLFTPRQLVALSTFSQLLQCVVDKARKDAASSDQADDNNGLDTNGLGAKAYGEAIGTYLAFVISSLTDRFSTLCTWDSGGPTWGTKTRNTFARQALPMTWDFAEVNPLSTQSGSLGNSIDYTAKGIACASDSKGFASQSDAQRQEISLRKVISTDPPYYDNIAYADLSDYFYVWLRKCLKPIYPGLYATVAVPKAEELVATAYRHGTKEKAEHFFLDGMTQAMHNLAEKAHPGFPVTIYYAFKQSETKGEAGTASTGWETFLQAVLTAGFAVTGTWPMRTELGNRMIGSGTNALASSIILVCRQRPASAPSVTRRQFLQALKAELPQALVKLQRGNIAPVDLAQAAIGPGMGVFSRYSQVLDAEGKAMTVREALALINETLDEALAEQEGDFDADTRWAITWFDQMGFAEGEFGTANVLAQAKNTGVDGLVEGGIVAAGRGKVRLLKPAELPAGWNPATDTRLSAWETVHQLVRALESGGEALAAARVAQLGVRAEAARELAYRLYALCERRKRAAEGLSYNALVQSWPEIMRLSHEVGAVPAPLSASAQADLLAADDQEDLL